MFAVHREDFGARAAGGLHDETSGHNQGFFVGQGHPLAPLDGLEGGRQSVRSHDGRNHRVCAVGFGYGQRAVWTVVDVESRKRFGDGSRVLFADDGHDPGGEFADLLHEDIHPASRREADDVEGLGHVTDHLERGLSHASR